jgi:hypothetical protein
MTWPMTGTRAKMDMVAMEGGALASVPARLLYGLGRRCKTVSQCGISAAQIPYFGSLGCCRVHCEGTARSNEALLPKSPAVPPASPTSRGAGSADTSFWGIVKHLRGECGATANEIRLDLGRELAANCSPSDALPHRPPVSNRGASYGLPNQRFSTERSD